MFILLYHALHLGLAVEAVFNLTDISWCAFRMTPMLIFILLSHAFDAGVAIEMVLDLSRHFAVRIQNDAGRCCYSFFFLMRFM